MFKHTSCVTASSSEPLDHAGDCTTAVRCIQGSSPALLQAFAVLLCRDCSALLPPSLGQHGSPHSREDACPAPGCTLQKTADSQAAAHLGAAEPARPRDQASKLHEMHLELPAPAASSPHPFPNPSHEVNLACHHTHSAPSGTRKVLTSASRGQAPWNCVLFGLLMPETALQSQAHNSENFKPSW